MKGKARHCKRHNLSTISSQLKISRNSNIELLRIISMLMIVSGHYVYFNKGILFEYKTSPSQLFDLLVLSPWSKPGTVVFFAITAWYFSEKEQNLLSCGKRVWIMEREILFYSISLFFVTLLLAPQLATPGLLIKSIFPLIFQLWWYPTAYAMFLLLLPALHSSLKKMNANMHLSLALIIIIIFCTLGVLPNAVQATKVFGFINLYIIITAYRWRLKPFQTKTLILGLILGILLLLIPLAANYGVPKLQHIEMYTYIGPEGLLPSSLVGLTLLFLFERRKPFQSQIINQLAKYTFGVYLISTQPAINNIVCLQWFRINKFCEKPWSVFYIIGIILGIFCVCTVIDAVRHALFQITVNRSPARWYYLLIQKISNSQLFKKFRTSIQSAKVTAVSDYDYSKEK